MDHWTRNNQQGGERSQKFEESDGYKKKQSSGTRSNNQIGRKPIFKLRTFTCDAESKLSFSSFFSRFGNGQKIFSD